ncbi:unnamed protein product [Cochlearia groenlandica]
MRKINIKINRDLSMKEEDLPIETPKLPYVDWFKWDDAVSPLRRFIPLKRVSHLIVPSSFLKGSTDGSVRGEVETGRCLIVKWSHLKSHL